jgi:hypothetical protein
MFLVSDIFGFHGALYFTAVSEISKKCAADQQINGQQSTDQQSNS